VNKLIVALLAMAASTQAIASGAITSAVLAVRVDSAGLGVVHFQAPIGGTPPGCVVGPYQNALAFNTNTAGGKAMYALLLSAKATGSTVTAYGLGTCSIFGSYVEDLNYAQSE
jgi:hypothetical protein